MFDSERSVCLTRWCIPPVAAAVLVFPAVKPVAAVGVRALVPGRGAPSPGEESEDLPGRGAPSPGEDSEDLPGGEPSPADVDGEGAPEPATPPAAPGIKSPSDEFAVTNAERFKFCSQFKTSVFVQ